MANRARLTVAEEIEGVVVHDGAGRGLVSTPHVEIEVHWDHGDGLSALARLDVAYTAVRKRIEETRTPVPQAVKERSIDAAHVSEQAIHDGKSGYITVAREGQPEDFVPIEDRPLYEHTQDDRPDTAEEQAGRG